MMCWTPKLYSTSMSWTYYVYAWTCGVPFDDTSSCCVKGHTDSPGDVIEEPCEPRRTRNRGVVRKASSAVAESAW